MSAEASGPDGSAAFGLVGHEDARRRMRAALASGRLSPALLVSGESGLGKGLFALWLVAASWCAEESSPCGVCRTCRKVVTLQHPDLSILKRITGEDEDPDGLGSRFEITVEQVRQLAVSALGLRPLEASGRAILVDGSDDMNEEAQNALLKVLEEPPRGARLVLISSRPDRMLPTIRSRCQEVRLSALGPAQMQVFLGEGESGLAALARGRPGRLALLRSLDVRALLEAFDGALAGRNLATFGERARELAQRAQGGEEKAEAVADTGLSDGGLLPDSRAAGRATGVRRPPDEVAAQRLVLDVLLARLRDLAAAASGVPREDPQGGSRALTTALLPLPVVDLSAGWDDLEQALLEAGEDLRRHIPGSVAWTAFGQALRRRTRG